jgi:hypothetical protein
MRKDQTPETGESHVQTTQDSNLPTSAWKVEPSLEESEHKLFNIMLLPAPGDFT